MYDLKKPPKDFYTALNNFLDTNGYFSICKECIGNIYVREYNIEHSLDRAIYKTCKIIDMIYSESAVQATEKQLQNKELLPDNPSIIGLYKAKIITTMRGVGIPGVGNAEYLDLTFHSDSSIPEHEYTEEDVTSLESVAEFWGEGYSADEYRFLEKELADWKRSYSCQNKSEEFFLKQISIKALELEKANKEGGKGGDSDS